jgi:hypothetical protein
MRICHRTGRNHLQELRQPDDITVIAMKVVP